MIGFKEFWMAPNSDLEVLQIIELLERQRRDLIVHVHELQSGLLRHPHVLKIPEIHVESTKEQIYECLTAFLCSVERICGPFTPVSRIMNRLANEYESLFLTPPNLSPVLHLQEHHHE